MRRAEELESRVGELEAELQALLDEYVEVQGRIRTLEALAGIEGEAAAERALADLPERLRRLAADDRSDDAAADAGAEPATDDDDAGDGRTAASQAEVAAAVEGVDVTDEGPASDAEEATDDAAPDEDDGLDDIIIG
jgi:hypothetical protein